MKKVLIVNTNSYMMQDGSWLGEEGMKKYMKYHMRFKDIVFKAIKENKTFDHITTEDMSVFTMDEDKYNYIIVHQSPKDADGVPYLPKEIARKWHTKFSSIMVLDDIIFECISTPCSVKVHKLRRKILS